MRSVSPRPKRWTDTRIDGQCIDDAEASIGRDLVSFEDMGENSIGEALSR